MVPVAFLANVVFIMASAGFELTRNELRTKNCREFAKNRHFETLNMKKGADNAGFRARVRVAAMMP